ncbi:hypothetical protein [Streptomyces sp. NPDC097610]|uniref:hypothetical protein n=1 Tax=Streptomyces sp. NPDC097610 TaxID=3157227 RepID=UPI003328AB8C
MEVTGVVVLLIIISLAPACKKLLTSVAYRIRAAGDADIIRAKHGTPSSDKPNTGKCGKNPKSGKGRAAKRRRHG